ncbi:Ferritin-like protein [Streptomyces sp. YIM 121038]|uniref:ferritin-like domain-containing protein n=1 Tax=Streptomyces sp. YIM 121038 TaxID=2136401 RepID=UPI001110C405|nr:ferritin-like domain-containing protein [Streptomyces sp. YIM 121038]QCX80797.1 Ferritin-like protein [Streptomyces sp. YIM 121038]
MAQTDPPPIHTIEALRAELQDALALEFTTIPAYLYGLLSIKDRRSRFPDVTRIVQSIVISEMRHMAIAANVLTAVGGRPEITKAAPVYPCQIPDFTRAGLVRLFPCGGDLWQLGLFIEQPDPLPTDTRERIRGAIDLESPRLRTGGGLDLIKALPSPVPLRFESIGDFYNALIDGITYLVEQGKEEDVVHPETIPRQYTHFGGQDNIGVRTSQEAVALLTDVIHEGEGDPHRMWDDNGELSHYYKFDELAQGRHYLPQDKPCHPTGPRITLPVDTDIVHVLPDPQMCKYRKGSPEWRAADDFNRFYERLVANLETGLTGHPQQVDSAVGQMHQLEVLADAVLACRIAEGEYAGYYAAPTFECRPYTDRPVRLPALEE